MPFAIFKLTSRFARSTTINVSARATGGMSDGKIPVTILSGSLGAGKTTVVTHLLRSADDRALAVLVNDMGEINIDAELLSGGSALSMADGGVAELSNGCICCELRDDLESEVRRLANDRDFDHLVVESSGISEPEPVARLFETGSAAAALYRVDTTVTVVNAQQLGDSFDPDEPVQRAETEEGETRPLSDLLIEQVEFADVILLNKCDLVSPEDLDGLAETLAALNPGAEIVRTEYGAVDPDRILDTGLFDTDTAEAAGWKRALERAEREGDDHDEGDHGDHDHDGDGHGAHGHRHPDEVYGVTSFAYRRERPFHPGRFRDFLASLPENVVRSKGLCWIAGREDLVVELGQAGPAVRVGTAGNWIASLPEIERDLMRRNRPNLAWDEEWGDRRTRLVFIGTDLDEDALVAALDDCLLSDDEMDADWSSFENPFPEDEGDVLEL